MNKEQFQKIMTALEARITLCNTHLGNIQTTADIGQLTLVQAADLKSFCISEEEIMTHICMVDLYHVIGMGKLTPIQMMKFTYSIQEYLEYRPTIKAIAKHLDSITELPKIPVETQYKLRYLGNFTLTKGEGEVVIDNASIDDYSDSKTASLPFRIEGRTIKVYTNQLEYFITLMSRIHKTQYSLENFKQKLASKKEYLGVSWTEVNSEEAVGTFKSNDMYVRLTNYYKSHQSL